MKFFADTAEIAEIQELAEIGLLDGVTTNPSLVRKSGRDFIEVLKEITKICPGPVSAEVVALDYAAMMREAEVLRKVAKNIAVKVPLTPDGLKACKALTGDGTMVNVTLCFSAGQALLAAKADASFISPFVGRIDDNGHDGMALIAEIKDLAASGLLDGVTTNPSLIMKAGRPMLEVIKEICAIVPGPVSAETVATDHKTMLEEGRKLAKIAKNVAVKVPLTPDGLKTCKALRSEGIMVNVTLCFSAGQALLAAKADASFISPFVGRIDDNGHDGMALIAEIMTIYRQYPHFKTEVLVASIRHSLHVIEAAKLGAHVATLPPNVLRGLFKHVLTEQGIAGFLADWAKTGQSI